MNANTLTAFSPRDFAIFRHVWSLGSDREKLDKFFILRSTVEDIVTNIDTDSHPHKTFLHYKGIAYEVECLDSSIRYFQSVPRMTARNMPVLMSMRLAHKQRLAICLLMIPHRREWNNISTSKFEEYHND